ncbi:hypothetical protein KP509_25G073800 [Ceratopteris richardii]|nr:hypothetical protein KP509_25G073800 [Ceratopteris richardii]
MSNGSLLVRFIRLSKGISLTNRRQELQIRMGPLSDVAGFGSQRTGGKMKHRLLTLDTSKLEKVCTFDLFARKLQENGAASKWERIGEILVEKETDVEMAMKERRRKLLAAAQHQYPAFLMLSAGEEVQYGYCKSGVESKDTEITVVDVKGKDLDDSIPAVLRADDGVKASPKRFQKQ